MGFPIALSLAWFLRITPDGVVGDEAGPIDEGTAGNQAVQYLVIAAVLIVSLVGVIAFQNLGPSDVSSPGASSQIKSIAVLPFDDFSASGDQQWFSDGLSDEILNSLVRVGELNVEPRPQTSERWNTKRFSSSFISALRSPSNMQAIRSTC